MRNHGCVNGTLDGANYSSPVPVIGLYVAAASSISMLLMLCDMVKAFRFKFGWLPNYFFSLNSVTLILLSVATKLTVDLTTPMPSSLDQLSKLCGTTFICITMGFLMPSLGGSETFTNLIALTIFVFTVAINICIQLYTGVISLFFVEHILNLCCMLGLLGTLWEFGGDNNIQDDIIDLNKYLFSSDSQSLFQRLKICYVTSFARHSQFSLCRNSNGGRLSGVCLMSAIILAQAAVRSVVLKQLKFCFGVSDYSWSMPPIVASQILAVAVGCFAIAFRWIIVFPMVDWEGPDPLKYEIHKDVTTLISPWDRIRIICSSIYHHLYNVLTYVPQWFMIFLAYFFTYLTSFGICNRNLDYSKSMQEFRDLIPQDEEGLSNSWLTYKCMYYMNLGIQATEDIQVSNLFKLLSQISPSPQSHINSMQVKDEAYPNKQGVQVSSFSLTLLVRIAQVSIPGHLCESLFQALEEADEIHQFIDGIMNSKAAKSRIKLGLANLLLLPTHDFRPLLSKILESQTEQQYPQSDLDRAKYIMINLRNALPPDSIWDEVKVLVSFIHPQRYSSIQDLYTSIEQLFVDLISQLLSQFPCAIFKSLCESDIADYGDVLEFALTRLSILKPLEEFFQWSFPEELNISRLITAEQGHAEAVVTGDVV